MGFVDKLVNSLHFNNAQSDDGFDDMDDERFDEDDELDEQPRRRSFFPRKQEDNEMEPEEDQRYEQERPVRQPAPRQPAARQNSQPMVPSRRASSNGAGMQVRVIRPSTFDQSSEIADTLLAKRTVLLNLEGLDVGTAQRIVDFASGACYALHGNFMKISHFIIVITPEEVDIAGDVDLNGNLMGMLNGASMSGSNGNTAPLNNGTTGNYGSAGGNTYNFGSYAQAPQGGYQSNYSNQYSNG